MTFRKYLTIAQVSFADEFAYRFNFILWRLRMFLVTLVPIFLWQAVFATRPSVFGYTQENFLTYLLSTILVRPLIFSSRSVGLANVIASGDLTNLLLKPMGFFRYFFVQDLESKLLNLVFAVLEFGLLALWLKLPLSFPAGSFGLGLFFFLSLLFSVVLFFLINCVLGFLAFWIPEDTWAPRFLFFVILEFFAGFLFPLDIFTGWVGWLWRLTPFYYFVFFPLGILLHRFSVLDLWLGFFLAAGWVLVLYFLAVKMWQAGLKVYGAWGR